MTSNEPHDDTGIPESVPQPWNELLHHVFAAMPAADPLYSPTSFWQPGVRALLDDLGRHGLENFKSWPSSAFFFYPRYPPTFTHEQITDLLPGLLEVAPGIAPAWIRNRLSGLSDVSRDIDLVLAHLDREMLPYPVETVGESRVGNPPQTYRPLGPDGPLVGKPFMSYLLLMTAVSRHLERPCRSVIEIGSGFGVLGEVLKNADPSIQYVNLDIPPLSVIAHHYLSSVFPDKRLLTDLDLGDEGLALEPGGQSASLSTWNMPKLTGRPDLFVNSFSFQEMEPPVVVNYADQIARLETEVVVSLNSREGKPLASDASVGVEVPVTSAFIRDTFEARGYSTRAALGRPFAPPQAELLVLARR